MDIKKRILEALRKSRKTQQLLAVELGVSRGAVSDMLKKEGDPPLKYVEATAKITGVSADWILYGNDGQPANIVSEPGGVYSREHFIQKVKDQQQIIALQAENSALLTTALNLAYEELEKVKKGNKSFSI